MERKQLLIAIGFICLALISVVIPLPASYGAPPTPEKPMVLNYDLFLPTIVKDVPIIEKFFKGLEEATRGSVKMKLHGGGAMGPATETYDRVIAGISEIGHTVPGYTPGVFPMFSIFDYPVRYPSAEVIGKTEIEMYRRGYFDKEFSRVKIIGLSNVGPNVLYSAKKRVTAIKDFAGLKVRCPTTAYIEFTKVLGGAPVTMAASEIFLGLQKGIIDANMQPWDAVLSFRLNEVCKYVTELLVGTSTHLIFMNKKTWEALPQEAKEYIDKNWIEFSLQLARANIAGGVRGKEVFSKTPGTETLHIGPDEWERINPLANNVWAKWISDNEAKGVPGRKAIGDFHRILIDLGVENPIIGYTPGK